MRKVVYSVLIGNYDKIIDLPLIGGDFDQILFTDQSKKFKVWKTINLINNESNKRFSRRLKILAHEYLQNYDASIYIDANLDVSEINFDEYFELLNHYEIIFWKHPVRTCIYEEASAVIDYKKDSEEIVNEQIAKYREEGYPDKNGLILGSMIIRKHKNVEVELLMNKWFEELLNHSYRDQLSFNYVIWKNNYKLIYLNDLGFDFNSEIKVKAHRRTIKKRIVSYLIKFLTYQSKLYK